jgi:hypothetical protein
MATAFVNAHITKALAAGADASTIDAAWLASVETWARAQSLFDQIEAWANPAFGTTKDGSNIISRIEIIGKPRIECFTPTTSGTTYNATGLNSTTPAFVNGAVTSFGHFGGGHLNNIRRKTGLTLVAAYQKAGTNKTCLIGFGEADGFALQNTSGNPGTANLFVNGTGWTADAVGSSLTNGAAHVIGGTITASEAIAYVEGVAGTPVACTDLTSISGALGARLNVPFLGAGSTSSKVNMLETVTSGTYTFSNNEALFTASDLIVFGTALTAGQMSSLNSLLRARIGA